jgi:hypothetical protein
VWKRIPEWWTKYWGLDLHELNWNVGWGEWTAGVITPFVITELAPALGCKPVRLEQTGDRSRRTRADYILVRNERELVYIEHETYSRDVIGEMKKLLSAKVPLKVAVTYSEPNSLRDLAKDILWRVEENKDTSDWLLIGGNVNSREEFENIRKWTGYSISTLDSKRTLTTLT